MEQWLPETNDGPDTFTDCLLLTDIHDPIGCIHFHEEDKCRRGVVLAYIIDDGKWLSGYNDNHRRVLHVFSPLPIS